ncbi:12418_t:CDS:2 [Gigaspora margarita]|uniref:12418_t:CDS:1 n=1 Tax=Gigaspora margarita TaxID=4874 RepID=A0ABN7UDB9_GIGMA|nr:12418_t:CDS:2 [Gigaspora margarita]
MINTGDRAVKKYTKALWQLVDKLTFAFYFLDPAQHDLFKYVQEMNNKGYTQIFNFYKKGLVCLYNILQEDVYKIKEPVLKRKWVKELVNVLAKQYLLAKKG